jgi:hypothetical protein
MATTNEEYYLKQKRIYDHPCKYHTCLSIFVWLIDVYPLTYIKLYSLFISLFLFMYLKKNHQINPRSNGENLIFTIWQINVQIMIKKVVHVWSYFSI